MANSTRRRHARNHQSAKPHRDYPLTAHPSGRWCKKIKGRTHYFGPLADPDTTLNKWPREKDDLLAGRIPRGQLPPGTTIRDLANAFLRHKQGLMQNGELSPRTFADAHRTCKDLLDHFGKHRRIDDLHQDDFAEYRVKLAKRLGVVALVNAMVSSRGLESLEESIDDCLTNARNLDREGQDSIIKLPRRARNEVVWKLGQ